MGILKLSLIFCHTTDKMVSWLWHVFIYPSPDVKIDVNNLYFGETLFIFKELICLHKLKLYLSPLSTCAIDPSTHTRVVSTRIDVINDHIHVIHSHIHIINTYSRIRRKEGMTVYPYSHYVNVQGGTTWKRNAYNEIYSGNSLNVWLCLTTA